MSEENDAQLVEAYKRQRDAARRAQRINRAGWTRAQWADDAERLMHEPDGAITSLVNGHVMGLISERKRLREEGDRYRAALIEVDTYLAHDPDVWRIGSVAKAGDVLCDVLGAEVVRAINAQVIPLLCPRCGDDAA